MGLQLHQEQLHQVVRVEDKDIIQRVLDQEQPDKEIQEDQIIAECLVEAEVVPVQQVV
jgi:hypothetical protein